jgi:hypothetical protein
MMHSVQCTDSSQVEVTTWQHSFNEPLALYKVLHWKRQVPSNVTKPNQTKPCKCPKRPSHYTDVLQFSDRHNEYGFLRLLLYISVKFGLRLVPVI